MPRGALLLTFVLSLACTFALCELFFLYFNRQQSGVFRVRAPVPRLADAERFIAAEFDADLGWDSRPPTRNFVVGKTYFAAAFGDSFTHGAEVADSETWQARFESKTGHAILNLGVAGYGADQAVLKAEKLASRYPTVYLILALNSETYRRAVSHHSLYYFEDGESFLYAFKPVFGRAAEGFELVRPPCRNADCLMEVVSSRPDDLRRTLEAHDHWYRDDGLRVTADVFPHTLSFLRSASRWWQRGRERRGRRDSYFVTDYALDLTEYLIARFVALSGRVGARPLILILNGPTQVRLAARTGVRWDAPLIEHLREEGIDYVDSTRFLLDAGLEGGEIDRLRTPRSHFNAEGNDLVAEALVGHFRKRCGPDLERCR